MTAKDLFFSRLVNWGSIPPKFFKREILPLLADLRLAIILLLLIALFSISGTVIEQGQSIEFYQSNYPEKPALFGFLTWKVLILAGLDHVYRTWWFLAILVLFGTSLTACTFTRQLPALKMARNWRYYERPEQFNKLALSAELPINSLDDLTTVLTKNNYRVFTEDDKIYARKGIVGKIGPIIVHASMLIILVGAIAGSLAGFFAQEMVPSGDIFQVKNVIDAGPLSAPMIPQDWSVKVNRFWIDYKPDGKIDQFYSDLSVLDKNNQEVDRQTIYVNKPFRYGGVTMYQADWAIARLNARVNRSPVFQLPMALLDTGGKGKLWGTWVPTKPDLSEGVSVIAKDLQGTVVVYDTQGKLVGSVREGSSIEVNGLTLFIDQLVGSTGLQIKADPGIPIVYLGFGLLMLSVIMSYFSHSQIWALKSADRLYIGGKTNRANVVFERELVGMLDQLKVGNRE
jgi:cytochrome c biogenesis protein